MYIVFYERLLPHKADFVVGEFQQVTNDFGSIIREVNTRFDMHFGIFDDTDQQAVRQIRDQLTVGRSSFFHRSIKVVNAHDFGPSCMMQVMAGCWNVRRKFIKHSWLS